MDRTVLAGQVLVQLAGQYLMQFNSEEKLVDYLRVYYHPERFQYRMDLELDRA